MDGRAIGAGAVSDGGLKRLVTEISGSRPAGTVLGDRPEHGGSAVPAADGTARATKP